MLEPLTRYFKCGAKHHDNILSVECIQSWHEKSMFTFGNPIAGVV
jgi:hypothetical protein